MEFEFSNLFVVGKKRIEGIKMVGVKGGKVIKGEEKGWLLVLSVLRVRDWFLAYLVYIF